VVKRGCLVVIVLMLLATGFMAWYSNRVPTPRAASKKQARKEQVTWEPPPPPLPAIVVLQERFDGAFDELLKQSEKDGPLKPDRWWLGFSSWLNQQNDIPQETRDGFRRHLRAELKMPPE
jgi:hypothetical protein